LGCAPMPLLLWYNNNNRERKLRGNKTEWCEATYTWLFHHGLAMSDSVDIKNVVIKIVGQLKK